MDYLAILALIAKGLTVIKAVYDAGQEAGPAIKALIDLTTGAQAGTVTDQQMTDAEAILDGMIADFNVAM